MKVSSFENGYTGSHHTYATSLKTTLFIYGTLEEWLQYSTYSYLKFLMNMVAASAILERESREETYV